VRSVVHGGREARRRHDGAPVRSSLGEYRLRERRGIARMRLDNPVRVIPAERGRRAVEHRAEGRADLLPVQIVQLARGFKI
jgi:hypothetical protein